ncbi:MAG: OmpA family protein [Rhodospirillaceae bacterium]|nr:OmpA family protein [Rhodospirillales bacterium]
MVRRFELGFRRNRDRALTASKAVLMMAVLAGCSSVPDAINPVEWYKGASDLVTGTERPEVAAPAKPKGEFPDINKTVAADTRKDLTKGLPADRSNSKYAEPVRREVTPTKPLARRAPSATDTQVAGVPAKPSVIAQELSDGPPSSMDMTPPARAEIPENVAMPGRGKGRPLQDQFQRRLAESAQQTVRPGMVDMPQLASASRGFEDEPIHLVPPSSRRVKGGGKGLAAPLPEPEAAASFQMASVDFRSGSAELTAADRQSIAEVARVYKQTGGIVRVVGHAPAPQFGNADAVQDMMSGLETSMKRANAVARELSKRGVPGSKIMVGADPNAMADAGARVFLDVI